MDIPGIRSRVIHHTAKQTCSRFRAVDLLPHFCFFISVFFIPESVFPLMISGCYRIFRYFSALRI